MSLPPGFLDELRQRVTLGRVVGRKVTWDLKKSNQARGDLWAPCPFHQEKTASFHVDDRKGFYYCFGCHAKGDAISFVKETDNLSFMEAVEVLAREAGLAMPAQDPRAAEAASRAKTLTEVMELAVAHYRLTLSTRAGEGARAYLAGRGLTADALARWEVGWAPEDRHALSKALLSKGATPELLLEAGLTGDGSSGAFDRFAGRIIFPIRDARGRAVGLGGRSLDPNARAKYLNSPATPLFDKGRTLFNHGPAREAAGKGATLVVAEGYMDVIALSEAGFTAAVAPLGTAVTADQLAMLWRIAPEPVVALDGDAAGLRAGLRVVDLALPLLEAGRGLRFARLPGGQDPDDVIRAGGAAAMQAVLDAAEPMVRLLWQRETEGRDFDSPERRAALDKSLGTAIAAIRDPGLRRHYEAALRDLKWELWGRKSQAAPSGRPRGPRPPGGWPAPPARPTPQALASALAGAASPEDRLRDAVLAILLTTPAILPDFASEIEGLDCAARQAALRDALVHAAGAGDARAAVEAACGPGAIEALLAQPHVAVLPAVSHPGDALAARLAVAEALARLQARAGHAAALSEGMEDMAGQPDEWLTRRLAEAATAIDVTRRDEAADTREVIRAPNGLQVDKGEMARATDVFGAIDYGRGGRRVRS